MNNSEAAKKEMTSDWESKDWNKEFEGTPLSIVVPPYIRFLRGSLLLRKAQRFLLAAALVSRTNEHPTLTQIFKDLDSSKDTEQLGQSFETYFASQLSINLVSEVEHFFENAITATLRHYPEKMGKTTFTLSDIMAADSTSELVSHAARAMMNNIMYERPKEYLKKFSEIVAIDEGSLSSHWTDFVELKARRDLGIHNNWVVNEIYLRKLREVGYQAKAKMGERILPDFKYLIEASTLCDGLIEKLADLLAEKWIPGPSEARTLTDRIKHLPTPREADRGNIDQE